MFSSNFFPPGPFVTPPYLVIYVFNNCSKNEVKLKGFLAEVNLNGTFFSSAYFLINSSFTSSLTNKSCLFPTIPKTTSSPKTSLMVLNQYSNSLKVFNLVIS